MRAQTSRARPTGGSGTRTATATRRPSSSDRSPCGLRTTPRSRGSPSSPTRRSAPPCTGPGCCSSRRPASSRHGCCKSDATPFRKTDGKPGGEDDEHELDERVDRAVAKPDHDEPQGERVQKLDRSRVPVVPEVLEQGSRADSEE